MSRPTFFIFKWLAIFVAKHKAAKMLSTKKHKLNCDKISCPFPRDPVNDIVPSGDNEHLFFSVYPKGKKQNEVIIELVTNPIQFSLGFHLPGFNLKPYYTCSIYDNRFDTGKMITI